MQPKGTMLSDRSQIQKAPISVTFCKSPKNMDGEHISGYRGLEVGGGGGQGGRVTKGCKG